MHKLKHITVLGFLGHDSPINLALRDNASFIIGRNGTGKTTPINLISACLSVDHKILRETKFTKVQLRFKTIGKRQVPVVTVEKGSSEEGSFTVRYEIQENSKARSEEYFSGTVRQKFVIGPDGRRRKYVESPSLRGLRERLRQIYFHTWLSLHRGPEAFTLDDLDVEPPGRQGPVDRKLEAVFSDLGRYFTRLDRQVADRTLEFQTNWFLSFLATERSPGSVLRDLDLSEEKKAVEAIFKKFEMSQEKYAARLEKHIALAERAMKNFSATARAEFKDFLVMYDVSRLHYLVEQWQKLQERQTIIYRPRDEYLSIATEMLFRKSVIVDESNEVVVETEGHDPIQREKLSSGEKQLLIFLSETLLQERRPHIFLADEPELSLHVEWQEELVPNLFRMNPNAQVIFATHSPDIVGAYRKNVFDMEELFG